MAQGEQPTEVGTEGPSFRALLRYFLWLGAFGFGGPIASVGYMQRDLVEGRGGWIAKQDMLDGIALGQTMPGPLAAQVAMWVGYLRRGAAGALGTAAAFILPSFLFVITLGALYVRFQGLPWVRSAFYGVAPAVIAIIALAALKLARLTDGRDKRLWVISLLIGALTAITQSEVAVLFVMAGIVILIWDAPPTWLQRHPRAALLVFPGITFPAAASPGGLLAIFLFFLKAGAFIFGIGLAIVPFLKQGVIYEHHWLTEQQFFDAVAVGLITPGPIATIPRSEPS
jgi:chromate transporter